jgi:hypothetical protein
MMRLSPAVLVAPVAALAFALPADAATRVGSDPDTRVSFRLSGRALTVTVPKGANRVLNGLQGKRTFSCGRSKPGSSDPSQTAHRRAVWPRGKRSFTLLLPRDVSTIANFCLVEKLDGGDVATACLRSA